MFNLLEFFFSFQFSQVVQRQTWLTAKAWQLWWKKRFQKQNLGSACHASELCWRWSAQHYMFQATLYIYSIQKQIIEGLLTKTWLNLIGHHFSFSFRAIISGTWYCNGRIWHLTAHQFYPEFELQSTFACQDCVKLGNIHIRFSHLKQLSLCHKLWGNRILGFTLLILYLLLTVYPRYS